ncbi:hypothetical protein MVEN_01311900 [Mycena venus]|uniref:Uncharacterized protein n=1 Tax=Mycena venus TaxID=2733690 RepID=A0A8H7CWP4_9AGAR|nr:hypothetical protein MVEN_01311900 [Mycena venus]
MLPALTFIPFILFSVVTSVQFPGCLPDEDATIVENPSFPVFSPTGQITNLTLTYFTCPSRQAQAEPEGAPINICGIMDSSEVFAGTFNCDQAPGDLPKLADCGDIDTVVFDNLIRPMELSVPAQSGLAVSLPNNTCAIVFLNDDGHDNYQTCLDDVVQILDDLRNAGGCPGPLRDGFIGSVRSPIQPGVQNWEVRITSSSFLTD